MARRYSAWKRLTQVNRIVLLCIRVTRSLLSKASHTASTQEPKGGLNSYLKGKSFRIFSCSSYWSTHLCIRRREDIRDIDFKVSQGRAPCFFQNEVISAGPTLPQLCCSPRLVQQNK
ncbi:hypothetical protein BABINDRAFT_142530 [Babjeviella inositovora NRRL Y-12698]|uniref:Uncharacterized protein n=1 Tax=Babjeviella inositovora NRRL Y-12698 TaxID=984486 RepID=A0A1E3QP41_9ASCO|nr:uncharacterized protein BABINDRAFT_142530 [Babjeviella inositovora NRRL Y-12698]ODQ79420.1 hypothetical protein BABINDRAFT_142530 [Babjeviella inositovora NRRL Y-12698]